MSQKLLNLNYVLQKFVNAGFSITIKTPYLILNEIPYISSDHTIKYGKIVSQLNLSGNLVTKPSTHVVYFSGDFPCDQHGLEINQLRHQSMNQTIVDTTINYSFSNRNENSYNDEYEKIINYVNVITGPVHIINKDITPYIHRPPVVEEDDENYVFNFYDTNSTRGNFTHINNKLSSLKVGIIGLGGTGSYILDLIAKTPVKSIYLFDDDKFNSHNAFRAPGTPNQEQLSSNQYKVEYFREIYSRMHRFIHATPQKISKDNLVLLDNIDFAFISIDTSEEKREIIDHLVSKNIPFIDSGIGVSVIDDNLTGTLRNTFVNNRVDDRWKGMISFAENNQQYDSNIQIAEINSLAAALAVIKWKKYYGFYQDNCKTNYEFYVVQDEILINES